MKKTQKSALPAEMFYEEVKDPATGETFQTLSLSRTPAMLLSFAANKFIEAASNYYKASFGLGAVDWRMLFLLARLPGTTAIQAAKTIGVDKGTVSRSVARLSKKKFIVMGNLHANGRSRGLSLSPAGRALHDEILTVAIDQQEHLLNGFNASEVNAFCELLSRFTKNLEVSIEKDRAA